MPHIDYYCSTNSPNVYLAGSRVEELAARHGATITYKPVDLGSVFPRTGGLPLNQRHASRQAYRLQELRRNAMLAGLPLTLHPAFFPVNPAPSSYALIAAQAAGGGDTGKLLHLITRACWAEERNIADDEVIRDCLSKAGFDPDLADSGLLSGAVAYEANTEEAVSRGVFGVPFFITDDGECFWGQDRTAMLDLHLSGKL